MTGTDFIEEFERLKCKLILLKNDDKLFSQKAIVNGIYNIERSVAYYNRFQGQKERVFAQVQTFERAFARLKPKDRKLLILYVKKNKSVSYTCKCLKIKEISFTCAFNRATKKFGEFYKEEKANEIQGK